VSASEFNIIPIIIFFGIIYKSVLIKIDLYLEGKMKGLFKTQSFNFEVDFNDSDTAGEIIQNLPVESTVSTWGDEIYFDTGFKACAQNSSMKVEVGDVAYWPQGKCLCVFFGPTPASTSQRPEPASPVVVVGKTQASREDLRKIKLGEKISVILIKQ
jgi:hypothetical protein